jgi:hypothetical protein
MHKGMNTTVDEGQTPIVTTGGVFDEATCFEPSHFTRGKDGKPSGITPPLSADADKGDQDTVVCATGQRTHALTTRAACEEDGTGRGNPIVPAEAVGFNWQDGGGYGKASDGLGITEEGTGPLQRCNTPAVAYGLRGDAGREGVAKTPSADAEGRVRLRNPSFNPLEELSPTMDASQPHAVAFTQNQREEVRILDIASACSAEPGSHQQTYIAQPAVAYVKATNPHSKEEAPRYEEAAVSACLNGWDERHDPPKHMVACNVYGGNCRKDRPNGGFYVETDAESTKTLDSSSGLNPSASQGGVAILTEPLNTETCPNGSDERQNAPKHMVAVAGDTYNQTIGDTSIPVRVGNAKGSLSAVLIHAVAFKPGQSEAAGGTMVAFAQNQLGEVRCNSEVMRTVNTNQNASGRNTPMVMHEGVPGTAVAFANRTRDGVKLPEVMKDVVVPAITNPGGGGRADAVNVCLPTPLQEVSKRTGKSTDDPRAGIGIGSAGDPMYTLQAGAQHGCHASMQVRRLTPSECEYLQGFPSGHTDIVFRKKPAADGPRYRALGNSMAVPCMVWLGYRIHKATKGDTE